MCTSVLRRAAHAVLPALLLAAAAPAAQKTDFSVAVHGRVVHLTAPRWKATVEGGLVVALENRLTGELYARSGAWPPVVRENPG